MKIGTRSVLFGAHCFFLHPLFVARAWWKLYGFPFDPRLWVAFIVHDLGYIGKPNMDGPEGETHPEFGAWIISLLFDNRAALNGCQLVPLTRANGRMRWLGKWGQLCLFHSRYYTKKAGRLPSPLCFADKLAFSLTPAWLYLPMTTATGEIREYLKNAQTADSGHWTPTGFDKWKWHRQLSAYMNAWVKAHIDGSPDTWTNAKRNTA
jgi:hypothetical protein